MKVLAGVPDLVTCQTTISSNDNFLSQLFLATQLNRMRLKARPMVVIALPCLVTRRGFGICPCKEVTILS